MTGTLAICGLMLIICFLLMEVGDENIFRLGMAYLILLFFSVLYDSRIPASSVKCTEKPVKTAKILKAIVYTNGCYDIKQHNKLVLRCA